MLDKLIGDLTKSLEKKKKNIGYQWERIGEDTPALNPSVFNKVIEEHLPGDEGGFVFRMMSRREWGEVSQTGIIGGKVLPGQVVPGVTWWGDRVGDATSQVGGSIHALSGGKVTWGGERGVLIAVEKAAIRGKIVESRRAPGGDREYNAYKTKEAVAANEIRAVFYVGREKSDGLFHLQQLKSK